MALVMGQKFVWVLVVLAAFVTVSHQASSPQADSYVAAVVEYAPVSGATLENKDEIFLQNVAVYNCFMEEAARQGVDIIVFPEIGLASFGVPQNPDGTPSLAFYVPEPGSNPCNDNSSEIAQGLRELSCAARRHGLYAVVNLPERVNCSGCPCADFPDSVDGQQCPPTGAYFHNTNVAFDRRGDIVARYRKFNLYGEPGFVPTPEPEFAIFDTDFGVTFGTFICFDIMFEKPAAMLARDYGVCDFAFPTAWFSEAPFLTAAQAQAQWAYSLDVNLLGAGYNRPEVGSGGSGIYLGRNGTLQAVMPNSTTSRILVGTVPKMRRCQGTSAFRPRSRRASPAGVGPAQGGEDEDYTGEERTPLSAFHHIVRQRKYGHLDMTVDEPMEDDTAPAFIHRKMYDEARDAAGDDDDSKPPTGEHESKVPPHFMGLHQTDQDEDDKQIEQEAETYEMASGGAGDGVETSENKVQDEEEISHSSSPYGDQQKLDVSEKKIPGTTRIDPYDDSEPSKNPDLLRLYQDEPVEQLPEEFLEIEVPEIYEPASESEREQEYFKLPNEDELKSSEEETNIPDPSHEGENRQMLDTDDSPTATADNDDLGINFEEGKIEVEGKNLEAVKEQSTDGERNATQEEIEAALKKFEWLLEDKDNPEKEQTLPSAPITGEEDEEIPQEGHVDDTDDLLPDDHGLFEPDDGGAAVAETDTTLKQKGEDPVELTKESEVDTLVDNQQPVESVSEIKKPEKCRKQRRCHRDRVKGKKCRRKCKPRPKEQQMGKEPCTIVADDKPVDETAEYSPEGVAGDITTEGQLGKDEPEVASKPKRPCKPRERRESGCPPLSDGLLDDGRVNKSTTGLYLKRDNLEVYKTFTLNTDALIENSTVVLCDGTFCCNFSVVMEVNALENQPRYAYRLAVFDGVRSFDGVATGGLQVCGVIPCSRVDMDSCGMLTLPDEAAYATVFRSISVSGVFSTNHTLVTANSVVPGLVPLPADRFNMTSEPVAEKLARITLRTSPAVLERGVSLFTFAIYSRVFRRDGQPATTPAPLAAAAAADTCNC